MKLSRMERRTIQLVVDMMTVWEWVIDAGTVTRYVNDFTPCRVTYEEVTFVLKERIFE